MSIQIINGGSAVSGGGLPQTAGAERAAASAGPAHDAQEVPCSAGLTGVAGKADASKIKEAAEAINSQLRELAKNIRFSVDEATGSTVVRVVDADTGQTLRQIPSEETLRIQHSLERLQGVLLRHEA
jgi:flagellar protein FlaG